jgi:hypothetical protein
MNAPVNPLIRRYLSAEASAKSDWLQLIVMLVLLVLARAAQPLPGPATSAAPRPSLSRYLMPAADSSRFTIYDTHYNTHFLLGRQISH